MKPERETSNYPVTKLHTIEKHPSGYKGIRETMTRIAMPKKPRLEAFRSVQGTPNQRGLAGAISSEIDALTECDGTLYGSKDDMDDP